jgi:hypothetical protein
VYGLGDGFRGVEGESEGVGDGIVYKRLYMSGKGSNGPCICFIFSPAMESLPSSGEAARGSLRGVKRRLNLNARRTRLLNDSNNIQVPCRDK